jgi:L-fuconolactonase
MRVDAHQHFWRLADRSGAWPPASLAPIHRDFLPSDLAPTLRRAGVDASVLVQSLPSEADTAWLLELAHATPFVRGVVGWVDMKSAAAPAAIVALAADPLFKGVRPMLQDLPDDDWIADPATGPAAETMARLGLVFDALVLPRQLSALVTFAERHPALTVLVDHAAKPAIREGELLAWRTALARLAGLPNVHCKLSGLLTEAPPGADASALLPWVQVVWALFGPRRLVWGSDWPVLLMAADYVDWCALTEQLFERVDPPATPAERAAVLGDNAASLYRLRPTEQSPC